MAYFTKNNSCKFTFILFSLLVSGGMRLFSGNPISIELTNSTKTEQMVSHVLKVTNLSEDVFKGGVKVDIPEGIRSLSINERLISLMPGDSTFVSFKLVLTKNLDFGEKKVLYNLLDNEGAFIDSTGTSLQIERREQLLLMVDNRPNLLTNPDDSVRINVTLRNSGNITEDVYIVFNVPNLQGASPFTELTATLHPGEQRDFTQDR